MVRILKACFVRVWDTDLELFSFHYESPKEYVKEASRLLIIYCAFGMKLLYWIVTFFCRWENTILLLISFTTGLPYFSFCASSIILWMKETTYDLLCVLGCKITLHGGIPPDCLRQYIGCSDRTKYWKGKAN